MTTGLHRTKINSHFALVSCINRETEIEIEVCTMACTVRKQNETNRKEKRNVCDGTQKEIYIRVLRWNAIFGHKEINWIKIRNPKFIEWLQCDFPVSMAQINWIYSNWASPIDFGDDWST